jgi:hypothetical protein
MAGNAPVHGVDKPWNPAQNGLSRIEEVREGISSNYLDFFRQLGVSILAADQPGYDLVPRPLFFECLPFSEMTSALSIAAHPAVVGPS